MDDFSRLSFDDAIAKMDSRPEGLTESEVRARLERIGKNALSKKQENKFFVLLLNQLASPLVSILVVAGAIAFALGETLDAGVIFTVFVLNLAIGIVQEGRASQAFERLSESQERTANVVRGGERSVIPSTEVVPGDILILEAGTYVPADVRLSETRNLMINESALTGESAAVEKSAALLTEEKIVSDKTNMSWMGTLVESGFGKGVVIATGNNTELGRIAEHLADADKDETPIQEHIGGLAKMLAGAIGVIVIIIFLLGLARGEAVTEMLLIAITVAVSVLPEGLPAAVTIVLALGMESILKKGGLVRNLLAAETLGSTTTILTDKTGTLTEARMSLSALITTADLDEPPPEDHEFSDEEQELLRGAIRASDAYTTVNDEGERVAEGRPMEKAIVGAGLEHGLYDEAVSNNFRRIDLIPFESKNRFAASLNSHPKGADGSRRIYFSGAPETLLAHASKALHDEEEVDFSDDIRKKFTTYERMLSQRGRRFIALSYKNTEVERLPDSTNDRLGLLSDTVFVGLLAFKDPVRRDVPEAIALAQSAGIEIKMLTGDHPETALAIAREIGLAREDTSVVLGIDTVELTDETLYEVLKKERVFARVLPEQKLRIAEILKAQGEVVAMTGDGINDAPALRNADIGVALGTGTEVAKEASDLILLTNSFSVITKAIEEGRRIIDNLKKIIAFMLSTNLGELLILISTIFIGLPLPLLPTQILWVNIIGQGLLDFALAFEPADRGIMERNPRNRSTSRIITPKLLRLTVVVGVVTSAALLGLFGYLLNTEMAIEEIRTMMFIALSLSAFLFAFSFKSLTKPIWQESLFSNKFLILSLLVSIGLLVLSLTYPPLQTLLSLTPLTMTEFGLLAGFGVLNLFLIEIAKFFIFERKTTKTRPTPVIEEKIAA